MERDCPRDVSFVVEIGVLVHFGDDDFLVARVLCEPIRGYENLLGVVGHDASIVTIHPAFG